MARNFLKPIRFVPDDTRFPFVAYFKPLFAISIILNVITVILVATVGLNFGIDFRGGTLIELRTLNGDADVGAMRSQLGNLNLGDVQLQTFGAPNDVLIRVAEQPGGEKAQQAVIGKVKDALGDQVEIRRTEIVGATVSGELVQQASIALILTCLGIFVYVWFRFEWQFALGAIIALVHDVLLTVGVFAAFQQPFDLTVVAALLTILGYSINDTVVIYDRIRENLRKFKKMPLAELIDRSVNETLPRTAMTTGTTFFALLALYIFGGEVIRGFTFALLFGVIVGTYSTVYIAAPFLLLLGVKRDWSGVDAPAPASSKQRATADV